MGQVTNPETAFQNCRGRKTSQGEVKLFSEGVKGELNQEQKQQCEIINVENTQKQYFEDIEEVKKHAQTLTSEERDEQILDKAVNRCVSDNPEKPLQQQEECVRQEYEHLQNERGIGEY